MFRMPPGIPKRTASAMPGDAHDPRSADSLRLAARSPGRLLLLLGPGTCFVNDGLKDLLGVVVGSACILLF